MRTVRLIAITVGACLVPVLVYLSIESSKQSLRDHDRREELRQFEERQKREAAESGAKQAVGNDEHPSGTPRQSLSDAIDEDAEIANLKSPDREVLNSAIQRIQIHHLCRAVPDLLDILKGTRDDYIAGISAEAIVNCKQPATYSVVVDQFLERPATPALVLAVGETGSQDDRVYAKLHRLITEPNSDPLVLRFASHAKQQIDIHTQSGAPQP